MKTKKKTTKRTALHEATNELLGLKATVTRTANGGAKLVARDTDARAVVGIKFYPASMVDFAIAEADLFVGARSSE